MDKPNPLHIGSPEIGAPVLLRSSRTFTFTPVRHRTSGFPQVPLYNNLFTPTESVEKTIQMVTMTTVSPTKKVLDKTVLGKTELGKTELGKTELGNKVDPTTPDEVIDAVLRAIYY